MLTFIKLGGSLITDKHTENSFNRNEATRIASEIASALKQSPDQRLLLGHGGGSFGHFAAKRHNTIAGVHTPEQWFAFAQVAGAMAALSALMSDVLLTAGVPAMRVQPSASAQSREGELVDMNTTTLKTLLDSAVVPMVFGDVSLDSQRGGTIISTERVFLYLARHLPVTRIFLLGNVPGVLALDGSLIPEITPQNFLEVQAALGGSAGVDVTGGMESKVTDMLDLVTALPHLTIRIFDGRQPTLLEDALLNRTAPGTLIRFAG